MNKQIKWEKWKDPYGENIDDVEWPGYAPEYIKHGNNGNNNDDDDNDDDDDDDDDDEETLTFMQKPMRVMATSMGLIPLTEYTIPSKIFNFWVGHTNFPITEDIQDIIDNVKGVEILTIFSQYRLRIAIGKLFQDRDVMNAVSQALGVVNENV